MLACKNDRTFDKATDMREEAPRILKRIGGAVSRISGGCERGAGFPGAVAWNIR